MCHAQLDPKLLMQDAADRYRIAQPSTQREESRVSDTGVPPELMGGFGGVWARLNARVPAVRRPTQPQTPVSPVAE